MADNSVAWFFPKGLIEKDTTHFVDHTGKRRRKAMVGRSEKRRVYWHLGFIAKPVIADISRFVLKAAIIFSLDGKTPLESVEKMHKLHRGSQSWWNGPVEGLDAPLLTWIAGGAGSLSVPGGDRSM